MPDPISVHQAQRGIERARERLNGLVQDQRVLVGRVAEPELQDVAAAVFEVEHGNAHGDYVEHFLSEHLTDRGQGRSLRGRIIDALGGPILNDVHVANLATALNAASVEVAHCDADRDGVLDAREQKRLSPLTMQLLAFAERDRR